MMPQSVPADSLSLSRFSTKRALEKVAAMSGTPHYVGSKQHENVAAYLIKELQNLGLETKIQEGYILSDWGNLVKAKNIMARIKGSANSKALLLLSHYDSAPHSKSKGASDDASGIATILEGVRAFLHNNSSHKNDIILLFSDAEELGLNGAALFITKDSWAKEVGLAINFEARGTAGPSYMLMEVNDGNAALAHHFAKADTPFPVSNSLMYSIYKMLPNDTDLTVFREQGKIQGFNFAYIDDHFNYHTQQDDIQHIDQRAVAHQGSYLLPMLHYFSNIDLKSLDSKEDFVYFNTPFHFIQYPFSWVLPMAVAALILFLLLNFIGFSKRILVGKEVAKGFSVFFGALVTVAVITFLIWQLILVIYPQYRDIQQGFTYNGHSYIAAIIFLSLSICFLFYKNLLSGSQSMNYQVAPVLFWILLNIAIVFYLPGAGFFILPVFFSLLGFTYFIITQKTSTFINIVFAIPALIIFAPFITTFPIGLGLKMIYISAILITLVFGLLLPVFDTFYNKKTWSMVMFVVAIGFFIHAHVNSGYEFGKAKPNSLLYVYDTGKNKASWATYDTNLDEWTTTYLGQNPSDGSLLNTTPLYSKYHTGLSYVADAPLKPIKLPVIEFITDSVAGQQRHLKIKITPNRNVNRYDLFADEKVVIHNFKANGVTALGQTGPQYKRKGKRVISYYVVKNEPLVLEFSVYKNRPLNMQLLESSFDLLENTAFAVKKRPSWMIPAPFVLNDAIIIKMKLKPTNHPPKPVANSLTIEKGL
jgi:hypothetical protein